jgi:UDP-N-acetylenolpyruvoylglucosamine reductase
LRWVFSSNPCRYDVLAPDDLLGLKKLAEVCTALEEAGVEDEACWKAAMREKGRWKGENGGCIFQFPTSNFHPAAVLREELARCTGDLRIVAGWWKGC